MFACGGFSAGFEEGWDHKEDTRVLGFCFSWLYLHHFSKQNILGEDLVSVFPLPLGLCTHVGVQPDDRSFGLANRRVCFDPHEQLHLILAPPQGPDGETVPRIARQEFMDSQPSCTERTALHFYSSFACSFLFKYHLSKWQQAITFHRVNLTAKVIKVRKPKEENRV